MAENRDGEQGESEGGRIELDKRSQISAPSDKQILRMLKRQVDMIDRENRFNGGRVSQQVFLNAVVIGMEIYGDEFVRELYREGSAILAPAMIADEPHAPSGAGRPLRHQVAEAAVKLRGQPPRPGPEHWTQDGPSPAVKPSPPAELPLRGLEKDGRGLEAKDSRTYQARAQGQGPSRRRGKESRSGHPRMWSLKRRPLRRPDPSNDVEEDRREEVPEEGHA
jgi:hypothetical protein